MVKITIENDGEVVNVLEGEFALVSVCTDMGDLMDTDLGLVGQISLSELTELAACTAVNAVVRANHSAAGRTAELTRLGRIMVDRLSEELGNEDKETEGEDADV